MIGAGFWIRFLAVAWAVIVATYNREFLARLGVTPTLLARVIWNVALITPAYMAAFPLAKRMDEAIYKK